MPGAANSMAERVNSACGIITWFLHVREHDARSSDCAGHDPRLHDAVTNRAGRLIPRAGNYRRPATSPAFSAAFCETTPVTSLDS
jgi:hypothetical protein